MSRELDPGTSYASPVETYWVARFDYTPGEDLQPHQHPFYQLVYVIGGEADGHLDGTEFRLRRGALMLARPGQTHGLHSSETDPLRTLDTKFAVRDPELRSELDRISGPLHDETGAILDLMDELRDEGERGGRWRRISCDSLLARVAVALVRLNNDGGDLSADPLSRTIDSEAIREAIRFIEDHYAEEISTEDIAAAAGFSRQHLAKKFHEECVVSPHEYLLHYRIHRAKELLRETDRPIKEITSAVGFRSLHHFTRAFHAVAGAPPGQWRSEELGSICKDINVSPEFVNVYVVLPTEPGGYPEIRVARNRKKRGAGRRAQSSGAAERVVGGKSRAARNGGSGKSRRSR